MKRPLCVIHFKNNSLLILPRVKNQRAGFQTVRSEDFTSVMALGRLLRERSTGPSLGLPALLQPALIPYLFYTGQFT